MLNTETMRALDDLTRAIDATRGEVTYDHSPEVMERIDAAASQYLAMRNTSRLSRLGMLAEAPPPADLDASEDSEFYDELNASHRTMQPLTSYLEGFQK